jgi:hypothetical protein
LVFTLNCEENGNGGDLVLGFFGVWSGIHVAGLRRGGTCVSLSVVGRNLCVNCGF